MVTSIEKVRIVVIGMTQNGNSLLTKAVFAASQTPTPPSLKEGKGNLSCTSESNVCTTPLDGSNAPQYLKFQDAIDSAAHTYGPNFSKKIRNMLNSTGDDHFRWEQTNQLTGKILEILDTPGLGDSKSASDPSVDLKHLGGAAKCLQALGSVNAVVLVVKYGTPFSAEVINGFATYIRNFAPICRNIIVVHSAFPL
ncbi:hypothetical protein HDU81_005321 [Chytriomyces hyalinus]|nr:hypothetical protein HDU81_005321 [Chytriomyces hyalinus]